MEGHEGSWAHDTHAYPLLPQHGYALLAGFLMMYNGRGVSPLKSVPPTSSSGCTPYFPFGFIPPTSPSGLYPPTSPSGYVARLLEIFPCLRCMG